MKDINKEKSSLSSDLEGLLASDNRITLGGIFDKAEEKGFGLLLIVLSLPSALPVPAAGYSVPFGVVLFLIGLQMLMGKLSPVMPARAARVELSEGFGHKMLKAASWFLSRIEVFIRPRFLWIGSRGGRVLMGALVLLMSVLMMIPIPTTNTFPAMVIFLIGVGLSEDDGLFALAACLVGVFAVFLYVLVIYFFIQFVGEYGWDAIDQFKEWLKELFSRAM